MHGCYLWGPSIVKAPVGIERNFEIMFTSLSLARVLGSLFGALAVASGSQLRPLGAWLRPLGAWLGSFGARVGPLGACLKLLRASLGPLRA